ncbi:MAG: septum formation initiator family protein [Candidatus Methanosuratincola sp.]
MFIKFARSIAVLAITIGVAFVFVRAVSKVYMLREEGNRIKASIERLEKENAELRKKIELLEGDPAYIEKVAREELGMIRENERVYRFAK